MRHPPSSTTNNWRYHKAEAKRFFEEGRFDEALNQYKSAIEPSQEAPSSERQILLSNMVACRLKLGGTAQASAAVENAKQCIAINPEWSKGHVRLASAYIAMGDRSNDACNELQTALRLDPGNSLARQMLMKELRRDQAAQHHSSSQQRDPPTNPHYRAEASAPDDEPMMEEEILIDESVPLRDRISGWWFSLSQLNKRLLMALVAFLAMYVAMGGRFGRDELDDLWGGISGRGTSSATQGNYGSSSAYEQYKQQKQRRAQGTGAYERYKQQKERQQQTQFDSYRYSDGYGSYRDNTYGGYGNSYSSYGGSYGGYGGRSYYSNTSSSDGLFTIGIILVIAYICRQNGIDPMQAIWIVLMMNNRGRRGGFHYGRRRRHGFFW